MDKTIRFLLFEPEKFFAVTKGWTFRGFTLRKRGYDWQLITKVRDEKGTARVSFINTHDPYTCFWYLAQHFKATNAPLKWKFDKFE